ncbi:hypothetical protein CDD81_7262 [Ophiocordyceps australis]|uniref:EngB-type G domain-containing protein n=1 Tax=Ophiocordyceps australis TaxID=1399860 RepID=A0A2C5Y5N0_9HYPO|nr:hypothetical protein CDD81_7262 [Ophiocordyceps australis]
MPLFKTAILTGKPLLQPRLLAASLSTTTSMSARSRARTIAPARMRKPRPNLHEEMRKARYLEDNFVHTPPLPEIEPDLERIALAERLQRNEFGATIRGAAFAEPVRPPMVSEADGSPETYRELYASVARVYAKKIELGDAQGISFSRNDFLDVHVDNARQAEESNALMRYFKRTQFLYSAPYFRLMRVNDEVPEFIILGASNCGKSSFINALVGHHKIAITSRKAGATQYLNSYGLGAISKDLVPPPHGCPTVGVVSLKPKSRRRGPGANLSLMVGSASPTCRGLVLVDTPGYGFRSRFAFGDAVMQYLGRRRSLRGAILLLSMQKDNPVSEQDEWVLRALALNGTPTLVVVTKIDKIGSEWPNKCAVYGQRLLNDLDTINRQATLGKWRKSTHDETHAVCFTAARIKSLENRSCGIAHIRTLLMEMAGLHLVNGKVSNKQETIEYNGPVVSHEEIAAAQTSHRSKTLAPKPSRAIQPDAYEQNMQKAGPWPHTGKILPTRIGSSSTGYQTLPEPVGPKLSHEMAFKKEVHDVRAARRAFAWAKKPRPWRR